MFTTDDKAALDQMWHNHDAFGGTQYLFRYAFVGRLDDGAKHIGRHLQPLNRITVSGCPKRTAHQRNGAEHDQGFDSHCCSLWSRGAKGEVMSDGDDLAQNHK